jgi:tol-pal system protein YbgF
MTLNVFARLTFAAGLLLASGAAQAQDLASEPVIRQPVQTAQLFNRPPAGVPGDSYQGGGDSAALLVRIDRLEKEVRSLTGQIEQMQFQTRRLEEQLKRFQTDIDTRLEGSGGARPAPAPQRRGEAIEGAGPQTGVASAPPAGTPRGRGDAFDPSQSPGAPGAPRVLGQGDNRSAPLPGGPLGGASSAIIDEANDPSAPMDLLNPRRSRAASSPSAASETPRGPIAPQVATPQVAMQSDPAPTTVAPPSPRTDFDAAMAALRANQLDVAENGFKDFLQRYPTSQLVPSATFNLGDLYARRGRHREAAEQFLKVSTDHSKTSQAPMSLLKLGESLERLGAREQACAAWGEVGRKYPNASAAVKTGVERDMKRVQC